MKWIPVTIPLPNNAKATLLETKTDLTLISAIYYLPILEVFPKTEDELREFTIETNGMSTRFFIDDELLLWSEIELEPDSLEIL